MKLRAAGLISMVFLCAALLASAREISSQQGRDGDTSPDVWGGMHVSMEMSAGGASLEFDCARGTITEPIKANAKGEFSVHGTYTPEHGGPVQKNNPPSDLPAIYKGSIQGDTMQLELVLTDKDQKLEPLTLIRGKTGRVVKCR
jgi:hypothetical protein